MGQNPDSLLGSRTSASAECRHWSAGAVLWSSCAILLRPARQACAARMPAPPPCWAASSSRRRCNRWRSVLYPGSSRRRPGLSLAGIHQAARAGKCGSARNNPVQPAAGQLLSRRGGQPTPPGPRRVLRPPGVCSSPAARLAVRARPLRRRHGIPCSLAAFTIRICRPMARAVVFTRGGRSALRAFFARRGGGGARSALAFCIDRTKRRTGEEPCARSVLFCSASQ
jgi:hypothetical protein